MVYSNKRSRRTSGSTTDEDQEYHPNMENIGKQRKPTRIPKCFSKNALMARENRLRKKLYISNLEDNVSTLKQQNEKLSTVVENQSHLIQELRREIKYLKSVISNSDGIGKLMKNINLSTGMPVTTSLNNTQFDQVNQVNVFPPISKKTPHPWEEADTCNQIFSNFPTPESTDSQYSSTEFDDLNSDALLDDLKMSMDLTDNEILDMLDEKALETPILPLDDEPKILPLDDHNYHYSIKQEEPNDNVGVCLHVSNNKVSLEFCQNCNANAQQAWAETT